MDDPIIPDYNRVARPMTAKMKKQWIKALRSNKYRKGRGSLRNSYSGGYCCLGVANVEFGFGRPDQQGFLYADPSEVDMTRTFLPSNEQHALAQINDNSGGFDKVIEYIERIVPVDEVK